MFLWSMCISTSKWQVVSNCSWHWQLNSSWVHPWAMGVTSRSPPSTLPLPWMRNYPPCVGDSCAAYGGGLLSSFLRYHRCATALAREVEARRQRCPALNSHSIKHMRFDLHNFTYIVHSLALASGFRSLSLSSVAQLQLSLYLVQHGGAPRVNPLRHQFPSGGAVGQPHAPSMLCLLA